MGFPEIRPIETGRTSEPMEEVSKAEEALEAQFDRYAQDASRSYSDRVLPQDLIKRLQGSTQLKTNPLFSSARRMDIETPPSQRAVEGTIAAVTRFIETAPRLPSAGKKNADTRVVMTLDPSTGSIEHLQFAAEADKTAKIRLEDGNLSFPVTVRFDKKNAVTRLTLEPSTMTALHRLTGEISPELLVALGSLHGRPIEILPETPTSSKPSPLATGALSVSGLLAISPEILEVGAAAAGAVLLGRILFSDSGAKPSLFRRFLHSFSSDLAAKDWINHAKGLDQQGRLPDAIFAYKTALTRLSALKTRDSWPDRQMADAHFSLASLYRRSGKFEEAAQESVKASDGYDAMNEDLLASISLNIAYDHYIEAAHDSIQQGDFLNAGRLYEISAGFVPRQEDLHPGYDTWNKGQQTLRVLARAWQNYAKTGGDITENIKSIIKTANSYGISGSDVRQMAIRLDSERR